MKKAKISVKKGPPKTNEELDDFLEQANENPLEPRKSKKPKKEKPKSVKKPWEDTDTTGKKNIPPVLLPVEYVLKLQYIKEKIGVSVQETARRGIMQHVDNVLKDIK